MHMKCIPSGINNGQLWMLRTLFEHTVPVLADEVVRDVLLKRQLRSILALSHHSRTFGRHWNELLLHKALQRSHPRIEKRAFLPDFLQSNVKCCKSPH